jgi:sulfoxide reductase heme-binding subunit YedZ
MNNRNHPAWRIFRIAMHIAAWIPLLILVLDYFNNNLTANPIQAASQRTGRTAITFLTLCLAGTPLQIITGINYFKSLRKPLGLYAFFYAVIHFVIFTVVDYGLVTRRIVKGFVEKPFIWLGFSALIILMLLALTSYKWWKVKMGKRWKKLHQLVYLAGVIVVIHDVFVQKANLLKFQGNIILPVIYGSIIVVLLLMRIPWIKLRIQQIRMGHPKPYVDPKQTIQAVNKSADRSSEAG